LGPIVNKAKAIESLKSLGFVDTSDSVPWREAYPEYSEVELIGKGLAGARYREGLTQIQLSEMTGISQRHISEMEHGKRPIGKKNARLLGKVLKVDYRVFL
jgi:ribosome-binding protein aMBF1 (putative translation factor)